MARKLLNKARKSGVNKKALALGHSETQGAPTLLTEAEAASYISMSVAYLRMDRYRGRVGHRTPGPPWLQLGRRIRYDVGDLNTWLAAHRVDPSARRHATSGDHAST